MIFNNPNIDIASPGLRQAGLTGDPDGGSHPQETMVDVGDETTYLWPIQWVCLILGGMGLFLFGY